MYILPMTFVRGAACAARARARTEMVENILLSSAEACYRRRLRDCELDGCRGNEGSRLTLYFQVTKLSVGIVRKGRP